MTTVDMLHRLTVAVSIYRILEYRCNRPDLLTDLAMAYDVPRARLALATMKGTENEQSI